MPNPNEKPLEMELVMADTEQILLEALNEFCFQNIWNEPASELRANIVPKLIQERSVSGNISYGGELYTLPTTNEPYYVYAIPESLMYAYAARQVPDVWISTKELCNTYNILMHVYHLSGIIIQKDCAFFRKIGSYYLLAIKKKMSATCIPFLEMKNMRFTMYFDSDAVNKITVGSWFIPNVDTNSTVRRQIYEFIQNCPHGIDHTTVYSNGYEVVYSDMSSLQQGTYVDVIHDENGILAFDVDLTDVAQNVAYYSDRDKTYRQLIHTPKALNPDNKVLTHNTCDIHIRVKNEDGSYGKGLYMHRCADRGTDQVTHNDISIPTYILDAYRDALGSQAISIHVVFRQHEKNNVLIRDRNYIDLLYTCDDETIIKHLLGKISSKLSFWKAANLEKSVYVNMMFDVPNIISSENMWTYVEGLGYYHTMALLCKKIVHTDISAWYGTSLRIPKPYLYMNYPVFPFVYLNGQKIHNKFTKFANTDSMNLEVGVDSVIQVNPGDRMTVELFVDGAKSIYKIVPQSGAGNITVPFEDFVILEEFDISQNPAQGLDVISTKSYVELTDYVGNVLVTKGTGTTGLVFGPLMYGRTFIIQNRRCVHAFEKYLDTNITNGDPLYLDLHAGVRDSGYSVPIWNTPHVLVYLNGKYLIEGLDFSIHESKDANGKLATKQVILYNLEYLNEDVNFVEWFTTSAIPENSVEGFVVDNKAASPTELALLFPEMTMVHVDGWYESAPTDKGNFIQLPDGKYRQGAPFQTITAVPESIREFLSNYHPNDDIVRLTILNEYFYGKQPVIPDVVVLPKSHKCFSPYTVTIIRDILDGTLRGIGYDPDEERMRSQFAQYEYLAQIDKVIQNAYDLTYVDVFPHYRQLIVPDPATYQVLQAFIRIMLPKDLITSGEVYYDN